MVEEKPETAVADSLWKRWFPFVLVTIWVMTPEVRRLIDWQIGFNSLSVISLVPMAALLPLGAMFFGRKLPTLSREFAIVVTLWLGGFLYSFLVASLSGALFGAAFDFTIFCGPLLCALWLTTMEPATARRVFERFARAALWLGVITSVYGIYQFISPPAWDVAWVDNSDLASIGSPVPFGLRIFGTMNSPGILSDFLAMTILLTLHRLRLKTIWLVAPLLTCTLALALTFGRTGWLELAVGFVVYSVLSPKRGSALAIVAVTLLLTLGLAANLSLITGDPTSNSQIQSRLSTFNDIENDESANDRQRQTSAALHQALAEPLGQGLGTEGTATKLSSSGSTTVLDNGDLIRFLEMGVFGFFLYIAALVAALLFSVTRFAAAYAARERDGQAAPLVATAIAIQVALLGADISGDHHSALMAVIFWMVVGLTATIRREERAPVAFAMHGQEPPPHMSRPARA